MEAPIPPELAFTGPRIRFESLELALTYPRGHGGVFRGNAKIERLARATLLVTLEGGPQAPAEWTGRGEGVKSDVVSQTSLAYVQSMGLPVAPPEWKRKGLLGQLVEPALVMGIVGGLVYLFYANRSD